MQKITAVKSKKGIVTYTCETINDEPSLTEQQYAKDCDANEIVKKHLRTGQSIEFRQGGFYADLSEVPDLNQALDIVAKAQFAFDELASDVRDRFGNSPLKMIEFLNNPKNREEAQQLGLLKAPEPVPEPLKVKIIPDPEPKN